jgi:hypothetical protein
MSIDLVTPWLPAPPFRLSVVTVVPPRRRAALDFQHRRRATLDFRHRRRAALKV